MLITGIVKVVLRTPGRRRIPSFSPRAMFKSVRRAYESINKAKFVGLT